VVDEKNGRERRNLRQLPKPVNVDLGGDDKSGGEVKTAVEGRR
jgi:hypothetical protein